MKKSLVLSALLFAGVCVSQEAKAQEHEIIILNEEVPAEIANFVKEHFSETEVSSVTPRENLTSVDYLVSLSDATELEFDSTYKIVDIRSKKELPESLILPAIRSHLGEYHSENVPMEWHLDRMSGKQKVTLDNGMELVFDKDGRFISVNL